MLLNRLIKITACRLPFSQQVDDLRQQRQWLIDLEHLLDPQVDEEASPKTQHSVQQAVDTYLAQLCTDTASKETDQQVAQHITTTFRERWWGLFTCYDVPDLPRTNNELERYMRRIKSGHRRIVGRNNVHDFIIRYGRYAACVDYQESLVALLQRLRQVTQEAFLCERRALDTALLREQKRYRFRHHQAAYLHELEARWATISEKV